MPTTYFFLTLIYAVLSQMILLFWLYKLGKYIKSKYPLLYQDQLVSPKNNFVFPFNFYINKWQPFLYAHEKVNAIATWKSDEHLLREAKKIYTIYKVWLYLLIALLIVLLVKLY